MFRWRRVAEERAPAIFENIAEQQHGHVAADAVAVAGDGAKFGELRGSSGGVEMIELGDIFPRRVVGIFGEGDESGALRSLDRKIKGRIVFVILLRGLDVIFGVFANPGMIEGGVIADEIEKEAEAAGVQFVAYAIEGIPGADARVGNVGGDGVGRGDDVGRLPAGERAIELRKICGIFEHDAARFGAAAPDAHQPDDIEAAFGDRIPGGVGDVVELESCGRGRRTCVRARRRY